MQPTVSGVVGAVHPENGDYVQSGQAIFKIDTKALDVDLRRTQRAHDDVHANLARLNAMLGIVSQQSQAPNAPITVPPELMDDPAAHLRSEARTFIITQQSLLNAVAQAQTRHSGLQQQLLKTEALLPINAEREAVLSSLLKSAAIPRPQWLSAQERLLSLRFDQQIQIREFSGSQ